MRASRKYATSVTECSSGKPAGICGNKIMQGQRVILAAPPWPATTRSAEVTGVLETIRGYPSIEAMQSRLSVCEPWLWRSITLKQLLLLAGANTPKQDQQGTGVFGAGLVDGARLLDPEVLQSHRVIAPATKSLSSESRTMRDIRLMKTGACLRRTLKRSQHLGIVMSQPRFNTCADGQRVISRGDPAT